VTVVTVTRGWGDWRKLDVDEDALSDFHIATGQGGHRAPLPRPMLAAFMSCDDIPEDTEFGHSCGHGPPPHRIKVLVQKVDNRASVYARLHDLAGER
jgi:hypothetical protein